MAEEVEERGDLGKSRRLAGMCLPDVRRKSKVWASACSYKAHERFYPLNRYFLATSYAECFHSTCPHVMADHHQSLSLIIPLVVSARKKNLIENPGKVNLFT
jgi:hypothetical protein